MADTEKSAALENIKSAKEVTDPLFDVRSPALDVIESRLQDFETGKLAIRQIKDKLSGVCATLVEKNISLPITILIDELDRCRPTYSIKLLEEIKHLFDVEGVVFVLAINSDQLSCSINAAYGNEFDSRSYTRRFFDRRYKLEDADLAGLVEATLPSNQIGLERFFYPGIKYPNDRAGKRLAPNQFIAQILKIYDVGARDAIKVMDILSTSLSVIAGERVIAMYYLSLIIAEVLHNPAQCNSLGLPRVANSPRWNFFVNYFDENRGENRAEEIPFEDYLNQLAEWSRVTDQEFRRELNRESRKSPGFIDVARVREEASFESLANPYNYVKLLNFAARFD